ncbi:cell wall hydrolase [Blautia sp. MSJ-36]|uniref:cell wall hydrolase n=1 Tax=Blautia sp. MSJ-36 TaxID=2841530 RepID=UPI0020A02392|nr:cell wall hydrolase [Blautia sp. MSJ-36]
MKNFRTRKWLKGLILVALLFTGCMFLSNSTTEVQAATAGFKTIGGKTYYIKSDGSKQKGWLTLGKYKYYFNKTTGVQVKGWLSVSGKKTYYFTSKKGAMVTGWMTDSKKHKRYFNPKTGKLTRGWMKNSKGQKYYFTSGEGVMATGWMKNSKGQKRYFYSNSGVMATGWLKNTSKNITYYFDTDTGYMYTGLNRISGKLYYFKSNGVMAVSTTVSVNGVTYSISATGVATAKTSKPNVNVSNGNVKVYDTTNSRYYTMVKEYKSHPGIANGKTTDEALLAALCEAEAGNQGKIGMEAVALCVLNRTIKSDKEFPSTIRGVIYENIGSSTTPQYSVVRDGALAKRLKGTFENRTLAYQAAREAMTIFNNYVKTGKARTLSGFKKKDFNYMYFMMNSAFKKQPLTFSKVEYEVYKDHTFFVDWV